MQPSLYPLILPFFQLKKWKLREVKGLVQVEQIGTQGNRIQIHARGQVIDVCTEPGSERLGRRSQSHSLNHLLPFPEAKLGDSCCSHKLFPADDAR